MNKLSTMQWTGLPIRRNHQGVLCNHGLSDGSAMSVANTDERFPLMGSTSLVELRLNTILETADSLVAQ